MTGWPSLHRHGGRRSPDQRRVGRPTLVPVIDKGALRGIVTITDLLELLGKRGGTPAPRGAARAYYLGRLGVLTAMAVVLIVVAYRFSPF